MKWAFPGSSQFPDCIQGIFAVKKLALMLGLLLLAFPQARAQDFPWAEFERPTMQELIKINVAEDSDDLKRYPEKGQFVFRGKIMPSGHTIRNC